MGTYAFKGKHVLITGASGGLGSALAKLLAAEGAKLVVTSRSEKALDELISKLPHKKDAAAFTADLSISGEAVKLVNEAVSALGYIDVLVNNAGVGYFALMQEATEENIRHLFEVNTFSPLALIKTLLPHMQKRGGGRVVNILSCAGRVPIPTVGVYGGSKSALAVMANTMRLELQPEGIDIINIYPGTVATAFEEHAFREEERPRSYQSGPNHKLWRSSQSDKTSTGSPGGRLEPTSMGADGVDTSITRRPEPSSGSRLMARE